MAHSNIFDEYAKIASEKGLIKLSEESSELKKYKNDTYPRVGSDDISTIEALYGVKPDSPIKYKHNIMEAAHPKAVVIAPSYDKLNGLVENEIERQNIDLNIATRSTTGKNVTQGPKYARKDLMLQLVRIANDMDNQNVDDLRALADDCIEVLTSKKANWPSWLNENSIEDAMSNIEQSIGLTTDRTPEVVPASNEKSFGEHPYVNEEPAFNNMDLSEIAKSLGRGASDQDKEFFQFLMQQTD